MKPEVFFRLFLFSEKGWSGSRNFNLIFLCNYLVDNRESETQEDFSVAFGL